MATGTAALAAKLGKKSEPTTETKKNKPALVKKSATKKTSSTKEAKHRSANIPWEKIVALYNSGKSTEEISKATGLYRAKTQKGKENPYPNYLVVGYLTKLANGIEVNGKKLSIVRGSKNKARQSAKDKNK